MIDDWKQHLDAAIEEQFDRMVEIRRHLHRHPDLSGCEHETSFHLYNVLDQHGIPVRLGPDGRGVIADRPQHAAASGGAGRGNGPLVALRADIDALRIHDAKPVEYRSRNEGVMHACGHDAHTAAVMGTIFGLAAAEKAGRLPWPVQWRAIFQPAEETSHGAREMIAAGALENVAAIFGLHVDPMRDTGQAGMRAGALTAACDEMEVRIAGRGGHAARPHESIDPIAAAAQFISSVYLFVPRAVDTHDPVVVTIGQVLGGDNPNVIPENVLLRGTLRTLVEQTRNRTKDHIKQLARGLAEASGATIEVEFQPGPPSVNNDAAMTELLRRAAGEVLGGGQVEDIARPSMGGEDFALYLEQVPGAMFRLGCRKNGAASVPLHSPMFDIDERALVHGAKVLARTAVEYSRPRNG